MNQIEGNLLEVERPENNESFSLSEQSQMEDGDISDMIPSEDIDDLLSDIEEKSFAKNLKTKVDSSNKTIKKRLAEQPENEVPPKKMASVIVDSSVNNNVNARGAIQ